MKRITVLIVAMGIMVAMFAGVAVAKTVLGTSGPDTLVGTSENDTIRGFRGADDITGRGDSDRLFGGRGDDHIDARDPRPEDDHVDCGPGFDRVLVDPSTEDVVENNCERVRVG